jgi:hypothetical protein
MADQAAKVHPSNAPGVLPRRRKALGECAYCDEWGDDPNMPYHEASTRCESGKRPHCTCDTCF